MTLENTTPEVVSGDPAIETPAVAPLTDETQPPADEKASDADKAAKALQRRIDRLTREKYQLRAENDQLRQPKQSDDDHPLTNDDVETRAEARARELLEVKQFNDRCNEVFDKGSKASKQFTESLKSLSEEIGSAFDAKGKPTPVFSAILDADEPHKLIIYLADKPDLAAEIAELSPSRQIRRVAQLEREMGEEAKPQTSNAPKPPQPVKTGGGSNSAPDPKDTARWIAYENEKLLAQRARK